MARAGGNRAARQPSPTRLREQAEKLRERLAAIEAQEKLQEASRHSVVGKAVLAHADEDAAFRSQLDSILETAVKSTADRKLLGLSSQVQSRRGHPRKGDASSPGVSPSPSP